MKKRIFLALIILIAFVSVGVISASEISVNDTYVSQDASGDLLAVENVNIGSDSSNILSINNVDTNLDENTIGANESSQISTKIKAPDVTLYYNNGTSIKAQLVDENDNVLIKQPLKFIISGIGYNRTTDEFGYASMPINLVPGDYYVNVSYAGNEFFLPTETMVNCKVLSTIYGEDLIKYYMNDTQYYATFLKGDGSPLVNTDVTFNINGVFYTRTTNGNGVAKLNINLPPNDYILTAIHPDTGYMYSNNITVLPTIIGKDLVKVYKDNRQYYATFLKGDGSPLVNTDVTFNINGVFYTRTTNSSGVAKLNINLDAGEYIITAYNTNDNLAWSNIITILGSSATHFITYDYNYTSGEIQTITTELINELGYGVPNKEVVIYAGSTATPVKTDDDGIATIDLDLIPGSYTIEYKYDGDSVYKSSSATSTLNIAQGIPVYFDISNTTIYYNKKETFDVTVHTQSNDTLANMPVYFTINGVTYTRNTDENNTARITINLDPGVYDIKYEFKNPGYQDIWDNTQVIVIDGNTSTLTGEDTTVEYGLSEKFPVHLTVGDVPLPDREVIFEVNGINYTRYTDEFGFAYLTINLNTGKYLIKYYYNGEYRINPSSGQAYVTVKKKIPTSMEWDSSTTFVDMTNIPLLVSLYDENKNPIANKEIYFTIGSKEYGPVVTSEYGIAELTVDLLQGTYVVSYNFLGDEDYAASGGLTQIIVTTYGSRGYGYWSFGADMNDIDLSTFESLGTSDIFLNFYAFQLYGESGVVSWIQNAKAHGINTHIWMQVFYSGGSWVNPVSGGSINQAYFNSVINDAKYYAGLPGVAGVHFDYLRYPGNAYATSGGTAAINEFVRQACDACHAVNPNIIMSAAIMPETTDNIYYYGQDVPTISQYLDVLIPMQYKGNYNAGTNWLASTTKWFVQNSNGAEIWSGLQSYISDDNPTKLTYTELFGDAQTVVDNGADGVILFRFGLSQFLNFNDLDSPAYGDPVTVDDVINAGAYIKNFVESEYTLPGKVPVGTSYYSVPQILYLMSQATLMVHGDIPKDNISAIRVTAPTNSTGDEIYDNFDTSQYINLATAVSTYCLNNNQAPNFLSTHIGDISYKELVYMFSRVLTYYGISERLPAEVYIGVFLEKPNLTVNMMPSYSTEEYSYQNYTTTWLNYCPYCGHYGALLVNPKHTYEGELTCADCDCDYCGVTGHEKIIGSDLVLTRLSESVPIIPGGDGDVISIGSIVTGASYIAQYYAENENFPEYVVVDEGKYTMPQFLYLMDKAIVQINLGNFTPITLIEMNDPSNSGDVIDGYLTKDQYLDVASRVYKFIENNGIVPAYASSTLGQIPYVELVDLSARILDYYGQNFDLPTSAHVIYQGGGSSKSIAELSKSLIVGQTTDRGKATALFNYVRDEIAYEFYYDTQKGAEGTLISGSGNCCDQAQLLVAMGRSVGLTVRFDTGYCQFSSGSWYGHVWTQFLVDGVWVNADPTSNRNSFGVINNWDTSSYTDRGTYDILPY